MNTPFLVSVTLTQMRNRVLADGLPDCDKLIKPAELPPGHCRNLVKRFNTNSNDYYSNDIIIAVICLKDYVSFNPASFARALCLTYGYVVCRGR